MAQPPVDWWSRIGLVATAIFTGATAVITWRAYQHGRTVAGARRPIVVDAKRPVGMVGYDHPLAWSYEGTDFSAARFRYADLYVYNQSDIDQRFTIDGGRSGIVWPRFHHRLKVQSTELSLVARYGGNTAVPIISLSGEWPADEVRGEFFRRRYWLRLRGMTRSGHAVKFFGLVRLRPYIPPTPDE